VTSGVPVVPAGTKRVEHLWGTAITLDVRDPIAEGVADEVFRWFERVDELFSTWRSDSEISRLGAGGLTVDQVSPEVREVLRLCDWVQEESFGAFDIRFGADPRVTAREGLGPIDPSALVKGWALGRAADLLRAEGVANFAINAGGDLVTAGQPRPGEGWRVGIQHPWARDKVAAVVAVSGLAVATSGGYERGDHIIDPHTGAPAAGLMSVTVITRDPALADAYATAGLVLGTDGPNWLSERPDVSAMAISADSSVTIINDFDNYRVE
jgi:thiamine biosynthesis lipoprotein